MEEESKLLRHVARAIRLSLQDPYLNLQQLAVQLEALEDKTIQKQTGTLLRGVYQLQHMAANLELYSRLSDRAYIGRLQRTELTSFFAQLASRAEDLLGYLPMELRSELPQKRCYGNLDRYLTEQIFWNLLSNAAEAARDPVLFLTVRREGRFLILSMAERTDPLPPQILSDFFQRGRVPLEEALAQRGIGLGLSLIRMAAEVQGGAVIASQDAQGRVTVTVSLDLTLPVVKEEGLEPEILGGLNPDLAAMSSVLPPSFRMLITPCSIA